VFGLLAAAIIFTLSTCTFWQPLNTMWNIWLFSDINPLILMLLEFVKLNVCNHIQETDFTLFFIFWVKKNE
jgi:hypothetical protein